MSARRRWTWPWLLTTAAARGVLAVVVGLAVWGAAPAAIGWHPTTVSSGSMLPRLHVGDVAVSRPLQGRPPAVGDVLLFTDPDHPDRLRMHRFVSVDADGLLVTRGDANPADDSTPVELAAVKGVGTLRVPFLGLPVIWVREGAWLPLGLTSAGILALAALAAQARRFTFDPPTDDDEPPVSTGPHSGRGSVARRIALFVPGYAALAGLVLAVAVPSSAAFSDSTSSAATLGAAPYFSCANAVAGRSSSPAYSPYLWYRMDETSSVTATATDSSGNGRTGAYGLTGKSTSGSDRSCAASSDTTRTMTFNGSSGYLSSPVVSGAAPNTFTIMVRFDTTTTRGGKLLGYGSSRTGASVSYDRHLYMTNSGQLVFGVYPNAIKVVKSPEPYNDGSWHLAAATLSSAGMKLYVDGELVASDTSTTSGQALTGGYWRIAYDNLVSWTDAPTSSYFAGTLDDAVVYTTALTGDQLAAQWLAGTCPTSGSGNATAPPC